jgi:hypothetical protein
LNVMIGDLIPSNAPRSVMEALTQVRVTCGSGGSSKSSFELSLATSKVSEIITDLLPGGYFDPPSRVVISATLNGSTTVLIDGIITTYDVVPSDEAGKSQLSIKGDDLTKILDLIDFTGVIPYPAMPAEARVALVLAKYAPLYQMLPMVIPSVLLLVDSPLDRVYSQVGTDLEYVNFLADRVGYTFFVAPGPTPGESIAYWGPKLRAAIPFLPQPTPLAIDWDMSSNVESLQFSFDGFQNTQYVVMYKLSDVPVPIPVPVPGITPLSPPLGQKIPFPLNWQQMSGLSAYNPIAAAAIALGRAADASYGITGHGTLDVLRYGSILNARTIVQVQGAGITFDGDYFVDSVTHTIKPGSYKQDFSLLRNALVGSGGGPFDPLSYGLSASQQLPALPTSTIPTPAPPGSAPVPPAPVVQPPLPNPAAGGPLPVVAAPGPVVPPTGGSVAASLPASPST